MGLYTLNRPRIWFYDDLVETPEFEADDQQAAIYVESGLISPASQET